MFDRDRDLHELTRVEIEQSARLLIAEYGAEAEALADMRVTEMLNAKNAAGVIAWTRILDKIQKIQWNESKPS